MRSSNCRPAAGSAVVQSITSDWATVRSALWRLVSCGCGGDECRRPNCWLLHGARCWLLAAAVVERSLFAGRLAPSYTLVGHGFMQDKIIASHTCFGGHMDVNC